LEHGGMTIPVYDCAACGKEWAIYEDGSIKRVYEGYPDA
jgi:DNA-directed RNA polymerase subunit RPC12/RpoP